MRTIPVSLLVLLSLSSLVLADDLKEIKTLLDRLNHSFTKENIEALMTEDHVAITTYYNGATTRAQQVKLLSELKMEEYKTTNMVIKLIGTNTALITYDLEAKGSFKGRPLPPKCVASAIWVKKDGKWKERFYQETPVK